MAAIKCRDDLSVAPYLEMRTALKYSVFASFGLSALWYFVCGKAFIPEREAIFNSGVRNAG